MFSAFGYIPDTALNFLSFVSVTGNELHLNSSQSRHASIALQNCNARIIAIFSAQRAMSCGVGASLCSPGCFTSL
jgi:hypothetical protein